ncbi:hypothetical protein ES332_D08G118600v1 [Gossypium tomentosum]|uniref:Uncharacterized protein n=1 Tax=Gossypium tomentosum TaxID=34277 RepID=A0A5D2JSS5_GOSTO|nr:hypothetical protein ES332_D08G118600v1 [Gossypium tomentosum]
MLTRFFVALSLFLFLSTLLIPSYLFKSPFNFIVFPPFQKKKAKSFIACVSCSWNFDFPSYFLLFLWNQTVQKIEIQQKYQHFL